MPPLSPLLLSVYTIRITGWQITNNSRALKRVCRWCFGVPPGNESEAVCKWVTKRARHRPHISTFFCKLRRSKERSHTLKYPGVLFVWSLCFKKHVVIIIVKARKDLAAMRVSVNTFTHYEQRLICMLYQGPVFSIKDYALGVLKTSKTQKDGP